MSRKPLFDREAIRALLMQNYEDMRAEGGHPLTPPVLERALDQIEAYLKKHAEIAEKVLETEVRLHSQEMKTAAGTSFMIEGVVDLVRDGDKTVMYDLKTQSTEQVKGREEQYRGQLNVYAWLWDCSKAQPLDAFGILALGFPREVMRAMAGGDPAAVEKALAEWESEIRYPMDKAAVAGSVESFKRTIDAIESHIFPPPPAEKLRSKKKGDIYNFATQFCANCDVRFSCKPYQEYIRSTGGKRFKETADFWEAQAEDEDLRQWMVEHVDAEPSASVRGGAAPGPVARVHRRRSKRA